MENKGQLNLAIKAGSQSLASDRSFNSTPLRRVYHAKMKEEGQFSKPIRLSSSGKLITSVGTQPRTKIKKRISLTPKLKILQDSFKKCQQIMKESSPKNQEVNILGSASTSELMNPEVLKTFQKKKNNKKTCFVFF